MSTTSRVGRAVSWTFGLDLRSLAALRIGLACVVLGDLAIRSRDLTAHYTDAGLLPRHVLLERLSDPWHFSLHLLGGGVFFQVVLFGAAALSACLLAVGLHTRSVTILCWLLTVSLQNRNPMLLSGADVMLRMLLFWGMFLPLGTRCSLDQLRARASPAPVDWTLSLGTAAYTLQMLAIYMFAGLIKLRIPAWLDGTGVAYALRAPAFATDLAGHLVHHSHALATLSDWVPYLELWSPLLLIVPIRTEALRLVCVALFWGLHVAIALVLDVGIFVPVCLVAWAAFLPAWTWDRLLPAGSRKLPARLAPIIDRCKSIAAQCSARAARGDTLSPAIASRLGRGEALLCACFVVYVLTWNLWVFREPPVLQMPEQLRWLGPLLRVDQRWDMFSVPITESGWLIIPARLASGAEVDLFTGARPPRWRRPATVSRMFSSDRWRKYSLNLAAAQYASMRLHYGQYLCRSWNGEHSGGETLEAFKLYFMKESIAPWSPAHLLKKEVIWEHECREGLLRKWKDVL